MFIIMKEHVTQCGQLINWWIFNRFWRTMRSTTQRFDWNRQYLLVRSIHCCCFFVFIGLHNKKIIEYLWPYPFVYSTVEINSLCAHPAHLSYFHLCYHQKGFIMDIKKDWLKLKLHYIRWGTMQQWLTLRGLETSSHPINTQSLVQMIKTEESELK